MVSSCVRLHGPPKDYMQVPVHVKFEAQLPNDI
jgi:hypothetical protein